MSRASNSSARKSPGQITASPSITDSVAIMVRHLLDRDGIPIHCYDESPASEQRHRILTLALSRERVNSQCRRQEQVVEAFSVQEQAHPLGVTPGNIGPPGLA